MKILRFLGMQKKTPRIPRIVHEGEHHDLKALYDVVNQRYFEGKLNLSIGWAGSKLSKPKTRIMFGSYNLRTQHIKIHRRLDQPHVPIHFIAFIIYHEMLHHVLPPVLVKRRRQIHHQKFREKERQFEEYDLAIAFRDEVRRNWAK